MTQITEVSCVNIVPGHNDRQVFNQSKLAELAQSISEHGLAQPITVRPLYTCGQCDHQTGQPSERCPHCGADDWLNGTYEIVAGERRYRAVSEILQWNTIPAIIRQLDDETADGIMLAENTGRQDLNPIEEANAYQTRIDRHGWSNEKLASTAGVSEDLVKRRLSLLKIIPEIQNLIGHGHFPLGHAEAIADLDGNRQMIALRIFRQSKNGLPLSPFRSIIAQLMEEQCQEALFDLESFWMTQVEEMADLPQRGKRAVTGAPTRSDLPPVNIQPRDNQGGIIDRYIAALLESGHEAEAAAIGNLYDAMVKTNYMSVPTNAQLLAKGE